MVLLIIFKFILCILLTFLLFLYYTSTDTDIGKKILFFTYILGIILIFNFNIGTKKCTIENVYFTDNEETALGSVNTHRHYIIKDSNDKLYDICSNGFKASMFIVNSKNPKKAEINYIKIGNIKNMIISYYIE